MPYTKYIDIKKTFRSNQMISFEKFQELYNQKNKPTTHVVKNSDGISVIIHGETEANQIATFMTIHHHEKYTVEAVS
jgi:hypothetical protein